MYVLYIYIMYNLVGGFNHLETYELVNGKGDIPYMKWTIKAMFQTTNQFLIDRQKSWKLMCHFPLLFLQWRVINSNIILRGKHKRFNKAKKSWFNHDKLQFGNEQSGVGRLLSWGRGSVDFMTPKSPKWPLQHSTLNQPGHLYLKRSQQTWGKNS